jgi:hypothetical protein
VKSVYRPKHESYHITWKTKPFTGNRFRGDIEEHDRNYSKAPKEEIDRKSFYRVEYGRYKTPYIHHYDPEKFHEDMERYRSHEIKPRPNGQRSCFIPKHVQFHHYGPSGECIVASCEWPILRKPWSRQSKEKSRLLFQL